MVTVAGGRRCGSEGGTAFGIPESVARRVTMLGALALLALSAGPARAAVAVVSGFSLAGTAAPGSATYTLSASVAPQGTLGTNRLMVVVLTLKTSGALTDSAVYTVDGTYGSAKLFQAAMSGAATGNPSAAVWIGCLKDGQIPSTAQNLDLLISSRGPTITGASMFVAFFSGVSQQWSLADGSSKSSATSPATVPASIFSPSSGGYVTAAAAPAAAPSVSGYTSPVTNTTNVGAFVGTKLGAGTDTPSATSTSVPLAIASISLNPDSYVGVGDGTPGSIAPMVAILNPGNNEIVSRHSTFGFKVQARVFSPKNGTNSQVINATTGVELFVNGSATVPSNYLTWSPKYLGTTGESGVWETTYNPPSDGAYTLQVQATNASGTVVSSPISITTKAPGTGDGNLLVRDNSSQLCGACHALPIHSSETSGNRLGSWAVVCRDCHQPHATTNIYLVAQSVTPPSISKPASPSPVVLTTTARTTGGIVNPQMNGICQGCHTRTTDAVGNPLFRSNVAPDANHNTGLDCMSCHGHASGFPRPAAGTTCHDCHGSALPRADNMPTETVPPVDTCGNTQGRVASAGAGPNRVGAHVAHNLGKTFSAGETCDQCHVPPSRSGHPDPAKKCTTLPADRAVFTWGAISTGTKTPTWTTAVTPTYNYGTQAVPTQTCSTVYCHGAFRNSGITATPDWNGTVTCGACHRNSNGTSAAPAFPHPARASDLTGTTCVDCHPGTSTPPGPTKTTHVNGVLDQISYGCSQCHGVLTTASPGVLPGTPTNAAPGATATAKDVAGATAIGTTAVGAHLSHLAKTNFRSTAITCDQCHVVPALGDTAHATGSGTGGARATLSWGNLANGTIQGWTSKTPTYTGSNTATFTTPNYGTTPGTCGTVFCHGAFPNGPNAATGYPRTWAGSYSATLTSTTLTCAPGASNPSTSCHGTGTDAQPAASPHSPGSWGCGGCHSTGYTWNGVTGTVDKTVHMNGKADASAGGPDCLGCHGAQIKGNRRAVSADFTKNSHHVRGAMSSSTYGTAGVGNNYDCVVCHMEGQIVPAAPGSQDCTTQNTSFPSTCTNPRYHQNKKIDLRDVDVTAPATDTLGTAFVYDVDTISTTGRPGTWGSAGNATNWQAQNQILDSFCLNCHDSNGANAIASFKVSAETLRTNLDPYFDGTTNITNSYDAKSRGQVVNIKDMVVAGATDLKLSTDPRPPNGVPDPPNGIYSRHAIRGKSLSLYKSTGGIPSANWNTGWNEMAVMSCADCHTNDGANTTSGNAHGSGSDYLLKDATGGATRGSGNTTYVCARCHAAAPYAQGSHVPNGNYYDGRTGSGGVFGIGCLNCHGGSPGNVGTAQAPTTPEGGTGISLAGFGRIHGTSSIFTNNAGGTRMAYRFMNGGSLRFYSPGTGTGAAQWQGASSACYTISTADSWSGCTAHQNKAYTKPFVRNLSY